MIKITFMGAGSTVFLRNVYVVFPGLVKDRFHPVIGSALDHAPYLVYRIILTGIQHEKPQAAVHLSLIHIL